jgi:hypothetical protein
MATARLIPTVAIALLLASCGSPTYRISLKDGREFLADGRPELQQKTGYYQYQNLQGRDALVRADEVLMIEQQ